MRVDLQTRAAYHEAGHAVAAKICGFRILAIAVRDEMPLLLWEYDSSPNEATCIVLAAGAAAEEIIAPPYDPGGSHFDAAAVQKWSQLPFAHFVKAAQASLEPHKTCLTQLATVIEEKMYELSVGYVSREGQPLPPEESNCILLSSAEIGEITGF